MLFRSEAVENQDYCLLNLKGRLDTLTASDLQSEVGNNIGKGHQNLILNFKEIDYISSAGLRVLLIAQKQVTPKGGSVVLMGINETLNELFEVSGFSHLFCFTQTLDESIDYFKSK